MPTTRQDPEAQAVSQTGEFSTGTSGDYSAGTHTLTRSTDAAMLRAQAEVDEARRALTAAAEERGGLLQRAEAAEAQLAILTSQAG